jgi:hypothetical protein
MDEFRPVAIMDRSATTAGKRRVQMKKKLPRGARGNAPVCPLLAKVARQLAGNDAIEDLAAKRRVVAYLTRSLGAGCASRNLAAEGTASANPSSLAVSKAQAMGRETRVSRT